MFSKFKLDYIKNQYNEQNMEILSKILKKFMKYQHQNIKLKPCY